MEIYLLRHAIAVPRGTPEYEGRDEERPLTDEGIKKMKAAAKGILALGLSFDRIYTSPFLRARHTAEIVANVLEERKILQDADQLGGDFSPQAVMDLLKVAKPGEKVLLVGHQPDLGELANHFLCDGPGIEISLKKGALMRIDFPGAPAQGQGTLMWLLEPGHLRAIQK